MQRDGNSRESLEIYRQLTLESMDEAPEVVARCIPSAIQCYQQLNETSGVDAYLDEVIEKHGDSWQVLQAAANGFGDAHSQ